MVIQNENQKKIFKIKEIYSSCTERIKKIRLRQSDANKEFLKKIEERKINKIRDNIK